MASSSGDEDYPALQEATSQFREGLAQFEERPSRPIVRCGEGKATAHGGPAMVKEPDEPDGRRGYGKQPHGIFGLRGSTIS